MRRRSRYFNEVLDRVPDDPNALVGFGLASFRTGNSAAAEQALRRCIARHPDAPGASLVLGTLLGQARRFVEAEGVMRACVGIHPKNGQAWQLLGNSLHRQGRFREAEAGLSQGAGDSAAGLRRVGSTRRRADPPRQSPAAEDALRRAAALNPNAPEPLTNLGRIQEMRGDLDGAIALHNRSLAAAPRQAFAYLNRGNARRFKGDFASALADFESALAVDPAMPEAIGCRGFTLLTLGRLEEGWPAYGARIAGQPGVFAPADATGWDGSPLTGKRIVVWTEYGLGDEIMFAGLLAELATQAAHCTVLCEPRLVALFRRSFPGVAVAARGSDATGGFDLKFALADAARWLRPSMAAFPKHGGYLSADPARVAQLSVQFSAGLHVGISWRSTSTTTGPFKTTRLSDWAPVLSVPGITFHSLQYGDVADEITTVGTSINVDPRRRSGRRSGRFCRACRGDGFDRFGQQHRSSFCRRARQTGLDIGAGRAGGALVLVPRAQRQPVVSDHAALPSIVARRLERP